MLYPAASSFMASTVFTSGTHCSRGRFDVTVATHGGLLPIHLAVKGEQVAVVEQLLKAGSPVLPRDNEGRTTLHMAAAKGNTVLVELLLTAQVQNGRVWV
jgi:ankyrin repeat protein